MTMRQYVHRFGLPPASQSNFESLAIDAAAIPRQRRRHGQKLTRACQRSSSHIENAQEERSFASMVLFDALALDAASCPPGQRWRAAHEAEKLMVAQQASALTQDSEVKITLSHVVGSFLPPSEGTSGFDPCCGSSDSTGDVDVSEMHKISDPTSSSTELDSCHDPGSEADL